MSKYERMSDFELRVAVADARGFYWHSRPDDNGTDSWIYSYNYCECKTKEGQFAVDLPKLDWVSIGSLIESDGKFRKALSNHKFHWYMLPNPPRSAAIIYLESLEGGND